MGYFGKTVLILPVGNEIPVMQKNTKRNIFAAFTYAVVLLLGMLMGQYYVEEKGNLAVNAIVPINVGVTKEGWKLQQIIDIVAKSYVDSVNIDSIQDGAADYIISHLDPYSSYLVAKESGRQTEILEGTFEGIGVEYFNLNDTLLVVSLIKGGPADRAGFRVGDRLLKIGDRDVAGVHISREEIEKLIRGRRGTTVAVHIMRDSVRLSDPIEVTRDQVTVSSLDVVYMLQPTVGYIKVRRFGGHAADEFRTALLDLQKQGARRLILDLRDNGGGYFHMAVRMAGEFFANKRLIVYTEGANEGRFDYHSEGEGRFATGELFVLVNEQTASASEIVAGAVQDWKRGLVVGRRSFGKGIVQEQFDFADGSAVNLSIARYFTPLGRNIQKKHVPERSITPDFADGVRPQDSNEALDTLQGLGGIRPDITVPQDSNKLSQLYREMIRHSFIEQFVYGRFTKQLPAYSIENFLQGYNLPDNEYHAFIAFVRTAGLDISEQKKNDLRDLIETDIEALVGRYYFGREAYFKVKNRNDPFIEKALEGVGYSET